ncbi:uncharacterized protein LODBEIA_P17470 [Lodderomyces beijingensis]|uniref:2',3'-cyclic-nucleotide 3'-phosphodiesterase n=1 Tax=Lodderomyces beijingensis TaxID=1775926 RepID=A0ABP0ZH86_9ASCO
MGVALWLCPKSNSSIYDKLSTLSGSLNTLFPGQCPRFEPHVTITTNVAVDLHDKAQMKEDVDKILSASAVALQSSLSKSHSDLVTLGSIRSERAFFRKLYFDVAPDPNLISFARIIREIFVIAPEDIEIENRKQNPHLYTTDHHGNVIRRKSSKKHSSRSTEETKTKEFDTEEIRRRASYKAAEWAEKEYHPHVSLVYSSLWPIDTALWRTIKTRITDYLGVDDVDREDLEDIGYGWDGGVLKLVLCEGDVTEWVVLGSVDIH